MVDPAKSFNRLPPETRRFIAGLSQGDIDNLKSVIALFRMVNSWCRVNRWIALAVIAAIVTLAQGFDALQKIVGAIFSIKGH